MGTVAQQIISIERERVITLLNRAFADEWLAYYQYWIGAKVAVGPMRPAIVRELEEHAKDELRHAEMVADRIIQLGGTPLVSPELWSTNCNCPLIEPETQNSVKILEDNIRGEQCAIRSYYQLLLELKGKDPVTCTIIREVLRDEVEHEEDLQALLRDLQMRPRLNETKKFLNKVLEQMNS